MELAIPQPRIAPRSSRTKIGHFVGDVGHDGFTHFLATYRTGMAWLPPFSALSDVPTSFGTARAYRFDGPGDDSTPVVLLPGRNASTPMWRANLPGVLERRTAYCVDLLGEAGLSVQEQPITGPDDQAQWLDETLAGLGLEAAHLMGVSIGGWTATNCAVRRRGRVASLVLLDPAMTFARIPVKTALVSGALFAPGVPEALRRRVLRWIAGGADADDSVPEAALISAGSSDFVLRSPMRRCSPTISCVRSTSRSGGPGTKPVAERADRVLGRSIARHQRRVSRRDRRAVTSLLGWGRPGLTKSGQPTSPSPARNSVLPKKPGSPPHVTEHLGLTASAITWDWRSRTRYQGIVRCAAPA